jgi:hypothetical protein
MAENQEPDKPEAAPDKTEAAKPEAMRRIKCSDITDTLAKAMDEADEFDHILILYDKKDEFGGTSGFFHAGSATCANLVWMAEKFKLYLMGALGPRNTDDD